MAADGLSVNTTLSQAANVARAQAKGQAPQADPAAAQKTLQEDKRVDRVKKTGETDPRNRIDPEERKRRERDQAEARDDADETTDDEAAEETGDGRGLRLDTTA